MMTRTLLATSLAFGITALGCDNTPVNVVPAPTPEPAAPAARSSADASSPASTTALSPPIAVPTGSSRP
jgi:hypothetical protein